MITSQLEPHCGKMEFQISLLLNDGTVYVTALTKVYPTSTSLATLTMTMLVPKLRPSVTQKEVLIKLLSYHRPTFSLSSVVCGIQSQCTMERVCQVPSGRDKSSQRSFQILFVC